MIGVLFARLFPGWTVALRPSPGQRALVGAGALLAGGLELAEGTLVGIVPAVDDAVAELAQAQTRAVVLKGK